MLNHSVLQSVIRRLPFPLVLLGDPPDVSFANDRFIDEFQPEQLDGAVLQQLANGPEGTWQPVKLRRKIKPVVRTH